MLEFLSVLIGYLLGSFPTAYIVARAKQGIDIREVGVRNMGAANVFREVNKPLSFLVLVVDITKGAAAVLIAKAFLVSQSWVLAAGFAAILGHNFPVYIGFRGGRGIASIIGIFLVLAPVTIIFIILVLLIVMVISRHIFASILVISPILPLLLWLLDGSAMLVWYSLIIVIFLILMSLRRLHEVRELNFRMKKGSADNNSKWR